MRPLLALGGALTVFGGAQMLGASGFLAAYLAGVVVGNADHSEGESTLRFFETFGWLAQNAGVSAGQRLFEVVFVVVIVSVAAQGWTAKPLARFLGLRADASP